MKTRTILIAAGGAVAAYFVAKSQGYDLLCSCTYGKLWNAIQGKPADAGCGCGGAPNVPVIAPSQLQQATALMPVNTGSLL